MNTSSRAERLKLALAQLDSGEHQQAVAALEALRDQHMPDEPDSKALSPEDGVLRARTLLALARVYPRQGRAADAVRAGGEALFWFEQQSDLPQACDAHAALAMAYALLGVGRESLDQAMAALSLARQLKDEAREGWALLRLGNAHSALGNPVQGRSKRVRLRFALTSPSWTSPPSTTRSTSPWMSSTPCGSTATWPMPP